MPDPVTVRNPAQERQVQQQILRWLLLATASLGMLKDQKASTIVQMVTTDFMLNWPRYAEAAWGDGSVFGVPPAWMSENDVRAYLTNELIAMMAPA